MTIFRQLPRTIRFPSKNNTRLIVVFFSIHIESEQRAFVVRKKTQQVIKQAKIVSSLSVTLSTGFRNRATNDKTTPRSSVICVAHQLRSTNKIPTVYSSHWCLLISIIFTWRHFRLEDDPASFWEKNGITRSHDICSTACGGSIQRTTTTYSLVLIFSSRSTTRQRFAVQIIIRAALSHTKSVSSARSNDM